VTDRDIAVRAVARGCDPAMTRVADVMTPNVTWCFEDQSLDEAEQIMKKAQIRRLPVLDRNQCLVGILSLGDLACAATNPTEIAKTLEYVSTPGSIASSEMEVDIP